MEFTSLVFAIFYSIIFLLYWCVHDKNRKIILLVANLIFYVSFGIKYALVLLVVIIFSFFMAKTVENRKKKNWLISAILGTVFFLIFYKYSGFILQIFNVGFGVLGWKTIQYHSIVAPIGISYYTFQAISYVVDVYKGRIKAEKNFLTYAVYISFFPTVLSGPIERAGNILPQLQEESKFDYANAVLGLERILWGCFKKLVIADNLAVYVNAVGADIFSYSGFAIVLANLGYTIQLYCDFSGYSDMAIGFAKMLNIQVKDNFRAPYFADSIKDFWARWHISLSGWLRDYIYIPLGGSRCSKFKSMINLMITFVISGIWHGAGIKYLIWGAMHGVLQCIERMFSRTDKSVAASQREGKKLVKCIKRIVTFLIINFTWLPFWLPTTRSFLYAITHMFEGIGNVSTYLNNGVGAFSINTYMIFTLIISLIILFIHDYKAVKNEVYDRFIAKNEQRKKWNRIFILLVILCCNCVAGGGFIYFQY